MQPSKSMVDYMMELNRLFLNSSETNIHTPSTASFQSSYSQPTPNYSSSSTDSYSPETFPELSYNQLRLHRSEYKPPETPRSVNEAPFTVRRPIVGRKILGSSEQRPLERSPESHFEQRFGCMSPITHWNNPEIQTPNISIESKSTDKNVFYELFPGENRGLDLRTPVKTPSIYSNLSPTPTISQSSPTSNFGMFTPPRYTTPFNYGATSPNFGASSPRNSGAITSKFQDGVQKMCTFCRKNGETPLVYMTHTVKEKRGNKNIVTCPILRSHVCSTCGVSGDHAHTITYCPVLRSSNNGMPLKSTTITLKNTRIKSNGRRRY
ncbi:hypothetical protein MSG28_015780 [Choristoneura fumiferana]|uniref:Uncharacterized protein n=1 Tax=Choristoneura fumiferana TaxID=7141 RepID=A0ACC0KCN1_CHOFU|nr:hypothetical protein MSG28_015780 [Choristoneura fumiferana]